jgi:hypothetical protein
MRYRSAILAVTAVVMLFAFGSASLFAAGIEEKDLLGTWDHASISKTLDGDRDPVKEAAISWTFAANGAGTYHQTVAMLKMKNSAPLFWELDGTTIRLFAKKGAKKPSAVYSVIEKKDSSMIWKNHKLGDYYHLVRKE